MVCTTKLDSTGLKTTVITSYSIHYTKLYETEGTGLNDLCLIAETPQEMIQLIHQYMEVPFGEKDIAKRKPYLDTLYSNRKNAEKILAVI